MANVKLLFNGTETNGTEEHQLVCYWNSSNEIFIKISMPNWEDSFIALDKSTAIKFHKELKKQISYIESEVSNG